MFGFACVRDCSRCPFAGCRNSYQTPARNPDPPQPFADVRSAESTTPPPDPVPTENETEPEVREKETTMPAVMDRVEYKLVEAVPVKRGLFGRRK